KGGQAAAKHGLLAEKVGFGLVTERRFEDARTSATHARSMSQRTFVCLARRILMDGDEAGNSASLSVNTANKMAGALRGDHVDVDVFRRLDDVIVDVESVREDKGLPGCEVRSDRF